MWYQIHFLRSMPLFHAWTKPRLARLTTILTSSTSTTGHVLIRQGDPVDAVMFVRKGTLELRVGRALLLLFTQCWCSVDIDGLRRTMLAGMCTRWMFGHAALIVAGAAHGGHSWLQLVAVAEEGPSRGQGRVSECGARCR